MRNKPHKLVARNQEGRSVPIITFHAKAQWESWRLVNLVLGILRLDLPPDRFDHLYHIHGKDKVYDGEGTRLPPADDLDRWRRYNNLAQHFSFLKKKAEEAREKFKMED